MLLVGCVEAAWRDSLVDEMLGDSFGVSASAPVQKHKVDIFTKLHRLMPKTDDL